MSGTTPPLRVAVIGARRVRQGTGPFLALQAAAAGAEVVGVWGTREASAAEAAVWLGERGVSCPAFTDWIDLLAEAEPQALVIAGPHGTHAEWLARARGARLHVLCEKPLEPGRPAPELARDFAAAGLVLRENCQWPCTLADFRRLHPQLDLAAASRFRMRMSPPMAGVQAWVELLSHPLSLLQAVAPGPVELLSPRFLDGATLRFGWRTARQELSCEVLARVTDAYPRPAEYAFDDHLMRREVEEPGYRFFFADGAGRRVEAEDPMPRSVAAFVRDATVARDDHRAPMDEDLVRRQGLFDRILAAWPG